tara:strand:- start:239 stop:478 length:240 start_codon:yes stop_codon:yes gene_type:complete
LILLKSNSRNIFLIIFGISIFFIIFFTYDTSCGVEHMAILNEIKIYEKSLDPEFCESVLTKINSFNNQCNPVIEILDCG